jgi:hypothetical protein
MASLDATPSRKNFIILAVVVLVAIVVVYWEWRGSSRISDSGGPSSAYFSNDDGATYFVGPVDQSVPFTKDGKTVDRAHVFKCGGKLVVGYLSRYTQAHIQTVEKLANMQKDPSHGPPSLADLNLGVMGSRGTEVKAPGGKEWVNSADPTAFPIMTFKCPDGSDPGEEAYP